MNPHGTDMAGSPARFAETVSTSHMCARGQRIAHGMLTLSIASGLAPRTEATTPVEILAFLGMDKVRFTAPVFIGDTIRVESEVIEARPSKSMPGAGILKFKNTVKNQRDEDVATWETALMVSMRPRGK